MHAATLRLMHHARRSPAAVLWLCMALLVWQAAVPWIAAVAATSRDQFTAEVCSVYGVRTVAVDGPSALSTAAPQDAASDPSSHGGVAGQDPAAGHLGEGHCALSGLLNANVWVPAVVPPWLDMGASSATPTTPQRALALRDATRHWVASLKQGPPARA